MRRKLSTLPPRMDAFEAPSSPESHYTRAKVEYARVFPTYDLSFVVGAQRRDGPTTTDDPGFFSYLARIPERGRMIAFRSNTDFAMGNCSYKLDEQLRNLLLGQPYEVVEP